MEEKFYAIPEKILMDAGVCFRSIDRVADPAYLHSGVSILAEKYRYELSEPKKIALRNKMIALRFALCDHDDLLTEIE